MKKLLLSIVLLSTTFSFAQEITGRTRTNDKYSIAVSKTVKEYLKNEFSTFDTSHADDATFNLNGNSYKKNEVKEGWKMHHKIYNEIKKAINRITKKKIYNLSKARVLQYFTGKRFFFSCVFFLHLHYIMI